jgi:hypothetical protein
VSWRRSVKSMLGRVAPRTIARVSASRSNRLIRRMATAQGLDEIAEHYALRHGRSVRAGPFAGLQYPVDALGSVLVPKLLGSYEQELHEPIERMIRQSRPVVVDVGCAEGYYAVGFARRLGGGTRVHAFDTDPAAQAACRLLARANQVGSRVAVEGYCDVRRLQEVLVPGALVVCDCEGYEAILLDPQRAPRLRQVDLLVELHETAAPGVTDLLARRFADTHDVSLVDIGPRNPLDHDGLREMPPEWRERALSEWRDPGQQWAVMTVRAPRPSV